MSTEPDATVGDVDDVLETVRRICLAMLDSSERENWSHPTFRLIAPERVSAKLDETG